MTISMFANQSSDITSIFNSTNNIAQTYQSISGVDFNAGNTNVGNSDFLGSLATVFGWGIAIAIVLATLSIVYGAITYMTAADSQSKVDEGKKRITSAVGGLILALISWLILFSVNENILTSNFLLRLQQLENQASSTNAGGGVQAGSGPTNPNPGAGAGGSQNTSSGLSQQVAEDYLASSNVTVAPGASVEGLSESSANTIGEISRGCCGDPDKPLVLSSGTESETIANQNNTGGVFEFDYTDNPENQEEIDEYFLDKINKEEKDPQTNQLPVRSVINGQEVEITPTFTGWTVEVINEKENTVLDTVNTDGGNTISTTNQNNSSGGNIIIDDTGYVPDNTNNNDTLTIQDLININNQNNNNGGNVIIDDTGYIPDNTNNNDTLTIDELNLIALQDQAFSNVFLKQTTGNISDISNELNSLILITRDYCCGQKTTIAGTETFKSSYNVTNVDVDDNSIFVEKNTVNRIQGLGTGLWNPLNNGILRNIYPNQNLIDISKYLDCRETRNSFTRWTCRQPDNFRELDGRRYYNQNKKGVSIRDIYNNETYPGQDGGINFNATYNNNSWYIKI